MRGQTHEIKIKGHHETFVATLGFLVPLYFYLEQLLDVCLCLYDIMEFFKNPSILENLKKKKFRSTKQTHFFVGGPQEDDKLKTAEVSNVRNFLFKY